MTSSASGPEFHDEDDGLVRLRTRLQELYRHSGRPSYRKLAERTGAMSQTTAHSLIRCARLPRWGNLELVVEALGGDVEEFRRLWMAADGGPTAVPSSVIDGPPPGVAEPPVRVPEPEAAPSPPDPAAQPVPPGAAGLDRRRLLASLSVGLIAAGVGIATPVVLRARTSAGGARAGEAGGRRAATSEPAANRAGSLFGGPLTERHGPVWTVATGIVAGAAIAVAGFQDGTLQVRDLDTGAPRGAALTGHTRPVYAVAVSALAGRTVAVSGSVDGTIRLWDLDGAGAAGPVAGRVLGGAAGNGAMTSVATGTVAGRPVAISGGDDGAVRQWDLAGTPPTGRPLGARLDTAVKTVAVGEMNGRPVALSGGDDHLLRLWDLGADEPAGRPLGSHDATIWGVALGVAAGRTVALSGGDDGVARIWDLSLRDPIGRALGPPLPSAVKAVAIGSLRGRTVALSGGDDGAIRLWDLVTGRQDGAPLAGPTSAVETLTVRRHAGRTIVLAGTWDAMTWRWDLGPA
ncbi:WD40 repeat domain-containing protein [Frankia tisae]|uniref:WD40 repeat domain-containing protein n=1 Tax=Frankia tisae TaxID=2950104 RepID=UPI0021C0DF93|nr:hypothetical protein [Frankia tisae]